MIEIMVHLIDKDALVAAIDIIMKKHMNFHKIACINGHRGESCSSIIYAQLEELRSFINNLEVKEVDLRQSYREYINNTYNEEFSKSILDGNIKGDLDNSDLFGIMSYGFELGLKAQK